MVIKITKKEIKKNRYRIYPSIYLNGDFDYITIASYIPIKRNNKSYLGFIRKEFERPIFDMDSITSFIKAFKEDVVRMQKRSTITDSKYITFYEIEDAKNTGDI
jgi:hypothetical protein